MRWFEREPEDDAASATLWEREGDYLSATDLMWRSLAARFGWPQDELDHVAARLRAAVYRHDRIVGVTRALITARCFGGGGWCFERGTLERAVAEDAARLEADVARARRAGVRFVDAQEEAWNRDAWRRESREGCVARVDRDDGAGEVPQYDPAHYPPRVVPPCAKHGYDCRPFQDGRCGWVCTCEGASRTSRSYDRDARGRVREVLWIERDGETCDACSFADLKLGPPQWLRPQDRPVRAHDAAKPAAEPARAAWAPPAEKPRGGRKRVLPGQVGLVLIPGGR